MLSGEDIATGAQLPRVLIVGAGFGGLSAAKALRGAPVDVTLIDKHNHHLFQPLLYQVATAALSPADIAVPVRSILGGRRHGNPLILMDEVLGIDMAESRVLTRDGAGQSFDYLILATGSSYYYFGQAKWPRHAPALKTLEDAIAIRERVLLAFERAEAAEDAGKRDRLLTFVVIGGGPTGVEMAGALAELAKSTLARDFGHIDTRQARIILIEAGSALLGAFPEQQGHYARKALERLGVEVRTGARVTDISAVGIMLGSEHIPAANVIWCAGVQATPVGDWTGAETARNRAVLVQPDLSIPGHPNIFVVGDAASYTPPGGQPLPGLAPVAKQQGRHAAEVILARVEGRNPPSPFRYRDWGSMATIGRSAAVGHFGSLQVQGFLAWLMWGVVHITYLVGFRNRIIVVLNWLWAWLTYAKGARLITSLAQYPENVDIPQDQETLHSADRGKEATLPSG